MSNEEYYQPTPTQEEVDAAKLRAVGQQPTPSEDVRVKKQEQGESESAKPAQPDAGTTKSEVSEDEQKKRVAEASGGGAAYRTRDAVKR